MKQNLRNLLFICVFPIIGFSQPGQLASKDGSLTVVASPAIEQLVEDYREVNAKDRKISGYRVQIYNGRKSESQQKKTAFLSTFPSIDVYHLYEAPEYKVQVGNFRTRLEAEKFLQRVIAEFGSGFVVKTRIDPPKLVYPIAQ